MIARIRMGDEGSLGMVRRGVLVSPVVAICVLVLLACAGPLGDAMGASTGLVLLPVAAVLVGVLAWAGVI